MEMDASGLEWLLAPHDVLDGSFDDVASQLDLVDDLRVNGASVVGIRTKIPPNLGQGFWQIIRTSPYMHIMTANATYLETQLMRAGNDRVAKARILLSGNLYQPAAMIALEGTGAFLEACPANVNSDYELGAGVPVRLVVLNWDPRFFTEELGVPSDHLPPPINHVFSELSVNTQSSITPLRPDILRGANDIFYATDRFSRELYSPYLHSKGREVACTILADLKMRQTSPLLKIKSSVRDMGRLDEVRNILNENYRNPPSIAVLARHVGINQTKLKALFKAVYGLTIHDFSKRLKMDKASELLANGDMTIAEISYAVGYEFPASFTHAFRKFYGHSPRQERRASGSASQNDG